MGEDVVRGAGDRDRATDRGGKLTYHGPGQLVGYPIVAVEDVLAYVRTLERAMVAALAEQGVVGPRAAPTRAGLHRRVGRGPQDRVDRRARASRE